MSEPCPCPDDPKSAASPSRESTGSAPPDASEVGMTMLGGSTGTDEQGNHKFKAAGITPSGAIKMSWEGAGKTVTLVNGNARLVFVRGSLVDSTLSGSGTWSAE